MSKKIILNSMLRGFFVACVCTLIAPASAQSISPAQPHAKGLEKSISEVHDDGEMILTVLSDQTHVLDAVLKSKTAVHYYSFTSVRGQDVLVSNAPGVSGPPFWELEYFDGANWLKKPDSEDKFSSLMPGTEVLIRVIHRADAPFSGRPYHLAIGSYPVLKDFEFSDEIGVNRIPSGYTEPSWLWTQGYTQGILKARFTDSVGAPLKGAVGRFVLSLKESRIRPVVEEVISDEHGVVTKVVNFERCAGGHEARDYVSYNHGTNTWRSYYYVGGYVFSNFLLGAKGEVEANKDLRLFGHICNQRLIKSVPGPA